MSITPGRIGRSIVRAQDLGTHFQGFLVAAVASLLLIRAGLALTGFPKIGGGGLHIAHMLWGGLLMLVAVLLLVSLVGRRVTQLAAVVAGLGFGTFIDELGKFITSDNDYFFRPAVAVIYVVFVLIFLATRAAEARRFSDRERVAHAFDETRDLAVFGTPLRDLSRLRAYLRANADRDPVLAGLLAALEAEAPRAQPRTLLEHRLARFHSRLRLVAGDPRLARWLTAGGAVYIGLTALAFVVVATGLTGDARHRQVELAGSGLAAGLAVGCTLVGLLLIGRSRPASYRWFERAALVNLLLGAVFGFYVTQFGALFGVGVNLAVVALVNGLAGAERHRRAGDHQANLPNPD